MATEEAPAGQWPSGLRAFMLLEGVEPALTEHALGLIGEEYRVAVEGDADLVREFLGRAHGVRKHPGRRHAGLQRGPHVGFLGR